MANVKISELNELTQVDDDDLLVVVDTSANETKKIRAENVGTGGGGDSTPIGTIEAYSGSTAPNGYLMCDGSAVSRNAYADLFAVIGTTYGSGDGSTTFNLPNLKGRTVVMRDTTQTEFDTLGETGGSKELQEHNHYGLLVTGTEVGFKNGSSSGFSIAYSDGQRGTPIYTSNEGTGNSGNLQPYIVLNYVIKAFKVSSTPVTSQVVNAYSESTNNVYSCDYINDNTLQKTTLYSNTSGQTGNITFDGDYRDYEYLIITADANVGFFDTSRSVCSLSSTVYTDSLYQLYDQLGVSYNSSTNKTTITHQYQGNYYEGANHSIDSKIYKIVGIK